MDVEVFSYCEEKSYFLLPDSCTEFDEEPRNSTIFITLIPNTPLLSKYVTLFF